MSVKFHEAYALDSQQDQLLWWDDFLGDQIQDEWRSTGVVGGSAVVVDQQTGGIVRLTTGNVTNDNWRIDWSNIRSLLVTKRVSMEVRVKLTQTAAFSCSLSLRFDWNNCVFFGYNSAVSVNWQIRCRDDGGNTALDSGVAADTSYHIFRIECHTHGANHVHFYIDGTETANSPINTNVPDDAGDYLQPFIEIGTNENVAKSMDVDYVVVRQEI